MKTPDAPEDPHKFVYYMFYWLGIGTLLPWNFFISVPGYWQTKWETVVKDDENQSSNETIVDGESM